MCLKPVALPACLLGLGASAQGKGKLGRRDDGLGLRVWWHWVGVSGFRVLIILAQNEALAPMSMCSCRKLG